VADSIFPFIDATVADAAITATSTIPREYAYDFDSNEFILENGKNVVYEGMDALKMWIIKALKTQRYCYGAYTWDYGQEFSELVGQRLSSDAMQSEAKRYLEEALTVNTHITGIKNVSVTIDGSNVTVTFTAETDQGEVEISGV
jgi:hypothetical protein